MQLIRIEYFCLVLPITLFIHMHKLANFLVYSMSTGDNLVQPLCVVKVGIFKVVHILATSFSMSKPQSASTTNPGRSLSRNPDKNLSLTLLPQVCEITPWGHVAIKTLAVFVCLYYDHVAAFVTIWDCVSTFIS